MAQETAFKNRLPAANPPKAEDKVESLARECFALSLVNHPHGIGLEQMAKRAIDSAVAFYEVWNKEGDINGR